MPARKKMDKLDNTSFLNGMSDDDFKTLLLWLKTHVNEKEVDDAFEEPIYFVKKNRLNRFISQHRIPLLIMSAAAGLIAISVFVWSNCRCANK